MACPTCSETMHSVGVVDGGRRVYWCPRCGTLRVYTLLSDRHDDAAPKLVERCRDFVGALGPAYMPVAWQQVGIAEAINPPEVRPVTPVPVKPAVRVPEDDGEGD